jgi:hypothetical protein
MSKNVLISLTLCLSECRSLIGKPVGLATKAVTIPVKAVVGKGTDLLSRPIRKTSQFIQPVTPVIQVR